MDSSSSSQMSTRRNTEKEDLEVVLNRPFESFDVASMASAYDEEAAKMAEFETGM